MICNNCKEKINAAEQPENSRPFPAFTVLGGVLGAIGATLTGTILIVPAAVVAGAVADTSNQRCEICGNEIEEDEPAYHLMEELDNTAGGQTYRPIGKSAGLTEAGPQQPGLRQFHQSFQPLQEMGEINQPVPADTVEKPNVEQTQTEFIFDEMEGKLVPKDLPLTEDNEVNVSLGEGFDDNVDVGFEGPQFFGLDDGTGFSNPDYFPGFQDDTSIDMDPFGSADDFQIGGL